MDSIVAERRVELEMHDSPRDGRARGDKAVYTASNGEVVVTGSDGVEIVFRDPRVEGRATGTEAVYLGERDVMELRGNPVVTTQYGRAQGDVVMIDLANTTLQATGQWKMQVNAEALNIEMNPVIKPVIKPAKKPASKPMK